MQPNHSHRYQPSDYRYGTVPTIPDTPAELLTPARKPRRPRWPIWLFAAAAVMLLLGAVAAINADVESGRLSGPRTVTSAGPAGFTTVPTNAPTTPPKPPKAAPAAITVSDGTWSVSDEIKPGTYTTTADGSCYWARLRNFDGELDSIITNGLLNDGARGRMTIKNTDAGVELTGRCTWTRK